MEACTQEKWGCPQTCGSACRTSSPLSSTYAGNEAKAVPFWTPTKHGMQTWGVHRERLLSLLVVAETGLWRKGNVNADALFESHIIAVFIDRRIFDAEIPIWTGGPIHGNLCLFRQVRTWRPSETTLQRNRCRISSSLTS